MAALTSQDEQNQYTQRWNDIQFDPNEKELTMYLSSDIRYEIDIKTMNLPKEITDKLSSNEFWKTQIGMQFENFIISNLGNEQMYIGYKNGYFIGFNCITIINIINESIYQNTNSKKNRITRVVISDDIKKLGKNIKVVVRDSKCKDFKPKKTTTEGIKVFYKCNLHYDEETGKVIRNISRLEEKVAKRIEKNLGMPKKSIRVEIEEEVSLVQAEATGKEAPEGQT